MSNVNDQPPPVPNDRPAVWDLVIRDMRERDAVGRERYGTPLQPHNGRDALVDAYQEGLDLVVYLRQRIAENDDLRAQLADLQSRLVTAPAIEEAITAAVDGAFKYGEASALKHAHLLTITPNWTVPILRAAIARDKAAAVEAGALEALDEFRRLIKEAGVPGQPPASASFGGVQEWIGALSLVRDDMASLSIVPQEMARARAAVAVDVLSRFLDEVSRNKPATATLGELLATAPLGSFVEWHDPGEGGGWFRVEVGHPTSAKYIGDLGRWTGRGYTVNIATDLRLPARLVPADQAELDPATRGEIGE